MTVLSAFLYRAFVKMLSPTAVALVCLIAGIAFRSRPVVRRICHGLAVSILLFCGNGSISETLVRRLESQYPAPQALPQAGAILVLSGGVNPRIPPRLTVEVGEAADRVLYGAHLFRQKRAPLVICTGNVVPSGSPQRSTAEEMAELLAVLSVPPDAILTERRARNTREHALNVCPMLTSRGIDSVLLVTSAMHMPRSVQTFRRLCPSVVFVPAPTDFRWTDEPRPPWYRDLVRSIPTPANLMNFSDALHEYVGIEYYRLRGWL